jgi:hypothetical protein
MRAFAEQPYSIDRDHIPLFENRHGRPSNVPSTDVGHGTSGEPARDEPLGGIAGSVVGQGELNSEVLFLRFSHIKSTLIVRQYERTSPS